MRGDESYAGGRNCGETAREVSGETTCGGGRPGPTRAGKDGDRDSGLARDKLKQLPEAQRERRPRARRWPRGVLPRRHRRPRPLSRPRADSRRKAGRPVVDDFDVTPDRVSPRSLQKREQAIHIEPLGSAATAQKPIAQSRIVARALHEPARTGFSWMYRGIPGGAVVA